MFLGSKVRSVRGDDNLTAICEPSRQYGMLNISQLYRPPRPVMGTSVIYLILLAALGPGVYSASKHKWAPEAEK
jgi:hypothetical protein